MTPQIAIFHINTIPSDEFEEFRQVISVSGLDVQIVDRDPPGPMAGVEWLMPTLVIGFVASSYFGGFFQEMGKDHYLLVKEQFKKLYAKVAGPDAPDVKLLGSAGKVKPVQPYSLYFSLVGQVSNGISVKLLLKKPISQLEYEQSVEAFLNLLRDINTGSLDEEATRRFQSVTPMGKTLLVVFDKATQKVVPINPRSGELVH